MWLHLECGRGMELMLAGWLCQYQEYGVQLGTTQTEQDITNKIFPINLLSIIFRYPGVNFQVK